MTHAATSRLLALFTPIALFTIGCGRETGDAQAAPELAADAPATVVDSVLPMEEALGRFRAGLAEPAAMGGADSRDALVRQVVDALRANDTLAFAELAIDGAEWAWLYYPTTRIARPPYELPPGVAWLQLQEANRKGVFRALREYGGPDVTFDGYACAAEPTVEAANRIWTGCAVTLGRAGEAPHPVRLFASIVERDGRFAVLSYDNDF